MSRAHPPLDDFLTGRVSLDDRRRIEQHLAECEVCRAEWELLTSTRELRRSSEAEPVPDELAAAVSSVLRHESGRVMPLRRLTIAAAIAAAAAVVVAGAAVAQTGGRSPHRCRS